MKSPLTHGLFLLCAICMFGDAVKAETVSVIEGDSVTLHTGVTEIRSSDVIEWRLNGNHIARISGGSIITEGALKLDRDTGDLKITNINTTDFGEYKLKITSTRGSPEKTFNISVVTRFDGVTVVAVMEGDSVVLHADTEILKDDEILWRFRNVHVIAKMKKDEDIFSTYEDIADGIFRHRLQLNHQTGNLIISDIRNKTSGLYEVDVKRRTHTIHKAFSVIITDKLNRVSVKEGYNITLASGVTELDGDDLVHWRFEHEDILAEINKTAGISSIYDDVLDGRFKERLKLDLQTGSLNITHIRTSDSGLYHLDITSVRHVIFRKFYLSVCDDVTLIGPAFGVGAAVGAAVVLGVLLLVAGGVFYYRHHRKSKQVTRRGVFGVDAVTSVSVVEGDSVTLQTDAELQTNDLIMWNFNTTGPLLAKINRATNDISIKDDVLDGRFRDRLKVDAQTGSLTIMNIRITDSGFYQETISSSDKQNKHIFNVTVYARLPIPVIISEFPNSSVSKCSLVCSVGNVSDATLSWYKGMSVLSSISVCDLNRSLSLHLECVDDSYSCVLNNPISNQTTHLNNTDLCQPCSDCAFCCDASEVFARLVLSVLVGAATVFILVYDIITSRKGEKETLSRSGMRCP